MEKEVFSSNDSGTTEYSNEINNKAEPSYLILKI